MFSDLWRRKREDPQTLLTGLTMVSLVGLVVESLEGGPARRGEVHPGTSVSTCLCVCGRTTV